MQEVTATLRFITPCLGNVRRNDYDRFERDGTGAVIFMSSWWREVLQYGTQAFGKHQGIINQVRIHARLECEVKRHKRFYAATKHHVHEAFLKGDTIVIRAMLPTGLPTDDFKEILRLAGAYRGISPYGWKDGYGQFEPVSVEPTHS